MRDLQYFTSVFVHPNMRRLRFETYGLVANLPVTLPRLKNAIVKWTVKWIVNLIVSGLCITQYGM